jgi:hypothetical protein
MGSDSKRRQKNKNKMFGGVTKKQRGGIGAAAGIALGMALPMLLNTGSSVVGSIFGKKQPQRQNASVNQQAYRAPAPPQWMSDRQPSYRPPPP